MIKKKNPLYSQWLYFLLHNQEWPTQRWSGAWTGRTGCRVRTAAPRNSMTSWWCAGGRGLMTGRRLNFCRTLSTTSLSQQRDNTRCSRDCRKKGTVFQPRDDKMSDGEMWDLNGSRTNWTFFFLKIFQMDNFFFFYTYIILSECKSYLWLLLSPAAKSAQQIC